jgi:hypothetical protein
MAENLAVEEPLDGDMGVKNDLDRKRVARWRMAGAGGESIQSRGSYAWCTCNGCGRQDSFVGCHLGKIRRVHHTCAHSFILSFILLYYYDLVFTSGVRLKKKVFIFIHLRSKENF